MSVATGARKAAQQAGKRFFLGVPCHRGHAGQRYTSGGQCRHCARERAALKYATDPTVRECLRSLRCRT